MGVRVKRGKDLFEQDEYVLQTNYVLRDEEEREVLDALAEHLSRLEGVWVYHADGRFQIRYTPIVVIAKKSKCKQREAKEGGNDE